LEELPVRSDVSAKAIGSFVLGLLPMFLILTGIPAILLGYRAKREIDQSKGRLSGRWMAEVGTVLGVFACLFTLALLVILPTNRSSTGAVQRAQCINNLKQIGLALNYYHGEYGCFPPRAITDKSGKPLLSWRVAILPYLEAKSLYDRFHRDEPWDSPHNLPLAKEMPAIFTCPSQKSFPEGKTCYQTVMGSDMGLSDDQKSIKFENVTDGTSKTLMVSESQNFVNWTQPADIPFDPSSPLRGFGRNHPGGFNAVFFDCSVHFLKFSTNETVFKSILTRSGGKVLVNDDF
jgi:prepilin-type processing-associated H-X9-DG protein